MKIEQGHYCTAMKDGTLSPSANPWLRQLLADLDELAGLGDYDWLPRTLRGRPRRLLSAEFRERSTGLGLDQLRARTTAFAIAPPGGGGPLPRVRQGGPPPPAEEDEVGDQSLGASRRRTTPSPACGPTT